MYYKNKKQLLKPVLRDGKSFVNVKLGDTLNLYCEGGFKQNPTDSIKAKCIKNNLFEISVKDKKQNVILKSLTCDKVQQASVITTNKDCGTGKLYDVGWVVEGINLIVYTTCHNKDDAVTFWTKHIMTPACSDPQSNVQRVNFIKDGFYENIKMDQNYQKDTQAKHFASVLPGGMKDANEFIKLQENYFLVKGHLMAKTDVVLEPEQSASMKDFNTRPQIHKFNGGNWLRVENAVHKFAGTINNDLIIYSGGHAVLKFKNTALYMFYIGNKGYVPVAKFFYKIIIAKDSNAGVVIIGVGDVYATNADIRSKYTLCPDISDQVKDIGIKERDVISNGYIYMCTVGSFYKNEALKKELPPIANVDRMKILSKSTAMKRDSSHKPANAQNSRPNQNESRRNKNEKTNAGDKKMKWYCKIFSCFSGGLQQKILN